MPRLAGLAALVVASHVVSAGAVEVPVEIRGTFSCLPKDLEPVKEWRYVDQQGMPALFGRGQWKLVDVPVVQVVPGKPGEEGRLWKTFPDRSGNIIQVWCLKANAKHAGPDFGYLYTPKNGKGVWIGACTLVTGQNLFNATIDTDTGLFTKFNWDNWEKDDGTNNKKTKFHYEYAVKRDRLTIVKSEGQYVNSPKAGDPRQWKHLKTVETQNNGPIPAPENFEDLKLNDTQLTALSGEGGIATQSFLVQLDPESPPGEFRYALITDAPRGSGILEDVDGSLRTAVEAGDMLTIQGVGIRDPSVSGSAGASSFGRWVVDAFTEAFVSFRATVRAELQPGEEITGFSFVSDTGGGEMEWSLATANELSGSVGFAAGTVASSMTASASRVGQVPPPGKDAGAQIGVLMKFPLDEAVNLATSTVRIHSVLGEAGEGGAGELIKGTDGVDLVPITFSARPDARPNGAIFETGPGVLPKARLEIQTKGQGVYDWLLRVDRATIPAFPNLCTGGRRLTTKLTTSFTIDDGVNPPVVVETVKPWRCLDLVGGDPHRPRTLRVP